uniref:HGWP repeat containing protein-like n=2 Tax=Oryza TaxID=4527 RepID=Q5VP96_ORYSJ|nr:HGWP repeat containing protein-like [Oryza sativa Japonica Group]
MVVLVHHQAYWSNLPNEDAMVLQDGSTNTKHVKTDLIGCIGDGCSHADVFLPSCVVLMDTNAARDCDLRLLRSDDYVASLPAVLPELWICSLCRFNVDEDCPIFHGFYIYCQTCAGDCARAIIDRYHGAQNVVINKALDGNMADK